MPKRTYYAPQGGLPPQTQLLTDRAMFTEAYAVIPKGTLSDIVTSFLPFWDGARFWVLSRPLSGFAETFSQYIAEVQPGGGSDRPETEAGVEAVLFVVEGGVSLTIDGAVHEMEEGGYAYIPPGADWRLRNTAGKAARFHWIRKAYQAVEGLAAPTQSSPTRTTSPRPRCRTPMANGRPPASSIRPIFATTCMSPS